MSKTIQDYRNIVKVLKLQLLKVRQENNSLSKTLGIASETQTSSFSGRLQKFKNNSKQFAKHMYIFTLFAHKCELIGLTTEMIFRIADKKRDKEVSVASLTQIMKRLKLKLDDVEVSRLLGAITKSSHIMYQEYLQFMSAFQINSEKYPFKSQRNYAQICLLKFGEEVKPKNSRCEQLYKEVTMGENGPYLSFENHTKFCNKSTRLKQAQVVAIFIALDLQSQCQIQKQIFIREMNKIYNLLQRGVSYLDDAGKDQYQAPVLGKGLKIKQQAYPSDDQIKLEEETGVEAGNKTKKLSSQKPSAKIVKGDSTKLVGLMKKQGIRANALILKLLEKQQKKKLIRPFSLLDFLQVIQSISKSCDKKTIMNFFKCMDSSANGSVSTDELIKLWLEGRQISDPAEVLYKLLARHLCQIQCPDLLSRFKTLGYQPDTIINISVLEDCFSNLNLDEKYMKSIQSYIQAKSTVADLVNLLESGGVKKSNKIFKAMQKNQYENLNSVIKKLLPKDSKNFPKYARMENQIEGEKKYWETIFTDEWACWDYCLQTASKLKQFWRDHEFGPTKGDPHGYRSIVANQSQVPPGLPFQDEMIWITFQQMLAKQGNMKDQVKLFSNNLSANDIVQGKLGDCWFVSSLSIIAKDDTYIKGKTVSQCQVQTENLTFGIHPILFQSFAKYGIYVFKFYKKFKPVFVVVDDLFPVEVSSSQLIFAKSPDPGLQWVAFLQKSYAKLHHSYSNMISGDIAQGLCDLVNCIPIKEDVDSENKEEMLKKLIKLDNQKQLMGCSISLPKGGRVQQPVELDGQRCGLFYAHAYSIGDVIDLAINKEQQYNLIRVRNPWGHGQWCLDWSDNPINDDPDYMKLKKYKKNLDQYYDKRIKEATKMREEPPEKYQPGDDGEFLMTVDDFTSVFSSLFTGFAFRQKDYICQYAIEQWDKKTPSGICKAKGASEADAIKFVKDNHQYVIQVSRQTDILMTLTQIDGRLYRGEKYPYKEVCNGMIILVFTLDNNQQSLKKFDMQKMTLRKLKFELRRQVDYWHKFKPGKYAVIPCKLKNKILQSQFQFRIYSEQSINLKKINGKSQFKILPKTVKNDNPTGISSMLETLGKISKS